MATAIDTIILYQQASPYILPTIELAARLAYFQEKKTLASLFSRTQKVDPTVSESIDKLLYFLIHNFEAGLIGLPLKKVLSAEIADQLANRVGLLTKLDSRFCQ